MNKKTITIDEKKVGGGRISIDVNLVFPVIINWMNLNILPHPKIKKILGMDIIDLKVKCMTECELF